MRTFSCIITAEGAAPAQSMILADTEQRAQQLARGELVDVEVASVVELREGGRLLWIEAVQPAGPAKRPLDGPRPARRSETAWIARLGASMAPLLLGRPHMFETEKLRLLELRLQARKDRGLLARIDRALQRLGRQADAGAHEVALQEEIEALAEAVERLR